MSKSVARLYTQFQPEKYALEIRLNEKTMQFSGRVVVAGKKVGRPSKRLTFHANGVKVTSGKVVRRDKKGESELTLTRINHQKTLQEVRLHTEGMAYPGEYTVTMEFEGSITDGMTGIYPCYFKESQGVTESRSQGAVIPTEAKGEAEESRKKQQGNDCVEKKLFATQFESHHAREAFPCIDEPEAKAVFELTLLTRDGVEVLSNTPAAQQHRVKESTILRDSYKWQGSQGVKESQALQTTSYKLQTTFQPTPRMSTYLLAFVTGELHKKTAKTKSGVEVNAWATTAQPANSLDFALTAATRSIEYFENYFGVPYPLPKADHVALPDFSSGAMENWGLITYRERVLLDYPGETSQSTREYIALVVAHETSHQWFGNLVTMRWWDDLWLNESFANMMEYQCVDSMFPEWHVWNMFVASEALSALRRDATAGVQPVHVDVHHPDEISTLFDPSIVYAKGGRLLYMLKHYIGEAAFQKGLSAYFQKHAYGNTTGDDLWAALSSASGKDVGAFMTPWLSRSGFPVVRVTQDDTNVTLTQEQFLDDPSKADRERLWPIPLFASQPGLPEVFETRDSRLDIHTQQPLLINTGAKGHYLVDYQSAKTKAYIEQLVKTKTLGEPDRLMLLNSSAMLARAGYTSYAETVTLLRAYTDEDSEPVWDIIGLVASEVRRFIDCDESLEPRIRAFSASLIGKQFARLGWEELPGESGADQKLRSLIIGLGMYGEDPAILEHARTQMRAYMQGKVTLPAELRSLIMSALVKEGDKQTGDFLLHLHDITHNSELQGDACAALTATRDPRMATHLLTRLKDSGLVKPQDVDRWLIYLLRNRYTRDTAWEWMVHEWPWLQKTFENDKSYDNLPRYAAGCVNTAAYAQKYHDLFDSKLTQPMLHRNIQIGVEEISNRLAWLGRDLPAIQKFFSR